MDVNAESSPLPPANRPGQFEAQADPNLSAAARTHGDARSTRRRMSSRNTRPARPVAVRGTADGAHRPSWRPDAVRLPALPRWRKWFRGGCIYGLRACFTVLPCPDCCRLLRAGGRVRGRGPPLLAVATGPYAGEGFDCPPLDTLFLAAPIASKGRLLQYAGRILRPYEGKATAVVHDYHDEQVGVLASSLAKRAPGYTSLGFPDPRKLPYTPSAAATHPVVQAPRG